MTGSGLSWSQILLRCHSTCPIKPAEFFEENGLRFDGQWASMTSKGKSECWADCRASFSDHVCACSLFADKVGGRLSIVVLGSIRCQAKSSTSWRARSVAKTMAAKTSEQHRSQRQLFDQPKVPTFWKIEVDGTTRDTDIPAGDRDDGGALGESYPMNSATADKGMLSLYRSPNSAERESGRGHGQGDEPPAPTGPSSPSSGDSLCGNSGY